MIDFSLEQVEQHLRQFVAPQAQAIDADPEALRAAFQHLGDRSWLGLRIPRHWAGMAIADSTFRQFQEMVARYSGALAFLQTQHQSASSLLLRSHNWALQSRYLPQMSTGAVAIGVGFSHLRRPGNPLVTAIAVQDGYEITGTIPWITGYGIFQHFIGAAICVNPESSLSPGSAVYGLFPLSHTQQPGDGQIQISAPMPLAAMQSTQTVTATCDRWFLPASEVVGITATDAIHQNDVLNVLQHSFFALGCARAGLDILEENLQQKSRTLVQSVYASLDRELEHCRQAIAAAEEQSYEARLQLRAWAIELATRCAHAAAIASAGAANTLTHPAQRVYREALVFSVAGQTADVMEASLARLIRIQYAPEKRASTALQAN